MTTLSRRQVLRRGFLWCARRARAKRWLPVFLIQWGGCAGGILVGHVSEGLLLGTAIAFLCQAALDLYNAHFWTKKRLRALRWVHPLHWRAQLVQAFWKELRFQGASFFLFLVVLMALILLLHLPW